MHSLVGTHVRVECPLSCGAKIPLPVTDERDSMWQEHVIYLDPTPLHEHIEQNHDVPE